MSGEASVQFQRAVWQPLWKRFSVTLHSPILIGAMQQPRRAAGGNIALRNCQTTTWGRFVTCLTPSVRISQESNLLAIPKNDPDHRHVADVGSQTR